MGMGRRRKRNKGSGIVWGRGRGEWWRERWGWRRGGENKRREWREVRRAE